jgi:hypothetical protein
LKINRFENKYLIQPCRWHGACNIQDKNNDPEYAMNTLHLPFALPSPSTKIFWIKLNRTMAWSLLISPPLQWLTGIPFMTGLWIDLAMLVAHAVLSYYLFGTPETKARHFDFLMHVCGFRPRELSERNRFLLSGHRIALALSGMVLLWIAPGPLKAVALLLFFYPMLRLSISMIQHVALAVEYAVRRWNWRNGGAVGVAVVVLFLFFSIANMVK